MNGLLRKDLLLLKASGKTYLFLVLFYAVFSFVGTSTMFSCMTTLILLILPLSSFSTDELARWDKFAAALPGGRRAVVKSKYQLLFLTLAGTLVLSFLVDLLVYFFGRDQSASFFELLATALACAAVGLVLNCLLYPLLFKYGSQKARIYLALAIGVIAVLAIGFVLFQFGGVRLDVPQGGFPVVIAVSAVILLAAAVVISYGISRRIYDKKEF